MAIRIAVCDDEEEQLQSLTNRLLEWADQSCISLEMRTFPSAESFLFAYEEDSAYDILILDIEMKGISGIELAKRVRSEDSHVEILFIPSHFEFISEGYEVDALHYLTKPVAKDKLFTVLSKAADRLSVEPSSLIISCQGETIKLYESDILYVESFLHYISIHTVNPNPHASGIAYGSSTFRKGSGVPHKTVCEDKNAPQGRQEYRIKESISSFEKRLSADFFRIHRSYLVSLKHITRISRTSVILDVHMECPPSMEEVHSIELPLARGKYDAINEAFIRRN